MFEHRGYFTVYEKGALTVVGFGGQEVLKYANLIECRDELVNLVKENYCKTLAFDLTGVKLVPSGMLGLMASMSKMNLRILVFNASEDMKDVFEITQLDQLIELHEMVV